MTVIKEELLKIVQGLIRHVKFVEPIQDVELIQDAELILHKM